MKCYILLLCLLLLSCSDVLSQVVVTNGKGTRLAVDSSKWTLSGVNIYNKNTGNVGLGNPSPTYKLDVTGKVRITDSLLSNSLRLASFTSGTANDSIITADPATGIIRRIAPSRLFRGDSTTASNGLTLTGKDVQLGGTLTKKDTIVTSATNTLSITGLQPGNTTDSILTVNATGVLRKIPYSDSSLYNNDGLLKANRNIYMGASTLTFDTTTLYINPTTNSIGIGTATPHLSAEVDITSTTGGILVPRMTTLQKTGIASPANGLLVYDITTNSFWVYKNTLWVEMITGAPNINTQTVSYQLTPADNGKIIEFNSASAVNCTIPTGLPAGFQVSISQIGLGQVTFVAGSGMTLRNAYNFTKTATQWSKAGVEITSTTTTAILSGDMQ